MALMECVECGHRVSSLATSCPSCGCPVAASEKGAGETTGAVTNSRTPDETGAGAESTDSSTSNRQPERTLSDGVVRPPRKRHGVKLALLSSVVLVASIAAYFALRAVHPTEEQCRSALERLYAEAGWTYDVDHDAWRYRKIYDEGIAVCLELESKDVDCILKETAPFSCKRASKIPIEHLERGLWCFELTDNRTGTASTARAVSPNKSANTSGGASRRLLRSCGGLIPSLMTTRSISTTSPASTSGVWVVSVPSGVQNSTRSWRLRSETSMSAFRSRSTWPFASHNRDMA